MSAYRATCHESTGYTPNFLVFGRENRAPPDIIFGSPEEEPDDSYDDFVEKVRERQVLAYSEVRKSPQQSAKRNKRYYDIGLKAKKFLAGEWVMYFNPRKLQSRQMKWIRQYEGPYLVTEVPSPVTAKIQRTAKAKPKIVHIDKLKAFEGKTRSLGY